MLNEPVSHADQSLTAPPSFQASEVHFHRLLESLPAAAYTCDRNGLITDYNRHAVRLWGREPKRNDPADKFCGSFKLFLADGSPVAHDQCWMARALRDGREYNGEEIVIERSDGSRVHALAHANPIRDASGAVEGAVNVLVDVTDREKSQEAQRLLAAIVDSSDDAIIAKTLDGRILSWNGGAERLFGYRAHEAIGASITLIIPPEKWDEERALLERLRRGERIDHFETVRVTKEGRLLDISLSISPIRDGAGHVVAASKVARDISGRKNAEETLVRLYRQLQEADRRKDEFLAMLAHELRNPLAPISNSLHLLRLTGDLSPAAERVRQIMERQVNHMVRLVDDLLEVSRISRGTIELRKEEVELASVIRSAVETSQPWIDAAGHQLALSLHPEPMTIEADPVRLTQVIANLLNNAAKYTRAKGQIWLTARPEGDEYVVSVRDNGIGIAADHLPHVFEMFSQITAPLDRTIGGLGIGLALVRALVELHGGRVEARSDGLGKGSEFLVHLPMTTHRPRSTSIVPAAVPAVGVPRLPQRRILVVDDTRAAVYTLARLLETMGQRVRTAYDAASALKQVDEERPDIVVSDLAMPHMNGYQLAERLRQDPNLRGMILVALTGYGQESTRQQAKEAGFDYYLVKPVSLDDLEQMLASLQPAQAARFPAVDVLNAAKL